MTQNLRPYSAATAPSDEHGEAPSKPNCRSSSWGLGFDTLQRKRPSSKIRMMRMRMIRNSNGTQQHHAFSAEEIQTTQFGQAAASGSAVDQPMSIVPVALHKASDGIRWYPMESDGNRPSLPPTSGWTSVSMMGLGISGTLHDNLKIPEPQMFFHSNQPAKQRNVGFPAPQSMAIS